MLFGVKLVNDVYPPWKDSYIDYERLKKLLEEGVVPDKSNKSKGNSGGADFAWGDNDESRFVEALDKELEKVYGFQIKRYNSLLERLSRLEAQSSTEENIKKLDSEAFQAALEDLLSEAQELDNFYRLNYTGFIKIVKKHDKLHARYPSVKSLLEVRLRGLPFHSEELSPLLYRISFLYDILRSNFSKVSTSLANASKMSAAGSSSAELNFKSFKFWVHNDNLMEVKTRILRHLPVLVYASAPTENDDLVDRFESDVINSDVGAFSSSSSGDNIDSALNENKSYDPVITALYFDNEQFELYNDKLLRAHSAPTLRFRWTGRLASKPDIFLEKRMVVEDPGTGNTELEETRLQIKQKFLNGFIFDGDEKYKERTLSKLRERRCREDEITKAGNDVDSIQKFILQEGLQPVLRTVYSRTAFQIPGDDRIRITIDSNIIYIREDSFDEERPIRDPKSWHRTDIDSDIKNPLKLLRNGEYSKFPYSVMEIKIRNDTSSVRGKTSDMSQAKLPRRHGQWINELTNSHLVKEVPKFSIYIQGVASLFGDDEKLDVLPFWVPELETDIRIDPKQAYEQEKKKLKKQKETKEKINQMRRLSRMSQPAGERSNENYVQQLKETEDQNQTQSLGSDADLEDHESSDEEDNGTSVREGRKKTKQPTLLSILAGADSKLTRVDSEDEEIVLPPGVKKPTSYIKNAGPVKVEAKVWLANERTFNRWLHVTTLLSILTFSIYNSVKRAEYPELAELLAYIFFALTLFSGIWAYYIYLKRVTVIRERSGQHLDSPLGPLVLAFVISFALIVNFVLAFRNANKSKKMYIENLGEFSGSIERLSDDSLPESLRPVQNFIFNLVGSSN
ncbi:hypothetical protein HG535_0H02030 [Zygotorulaspora mrakii]|uniref:SPX domain-containing protein n=1 Tax=Zygotorulaspora mrakii TaxID=42260 RepID=A0A7H9B922_ZYGMR|nr:uncharacterized protein HG535_0H02030 [Zygotorulaspora mrakii]QLG74876.1 hypothetical protein HG535_0H02030 [Zygotorulaspora mrakii]